MSVIDRIAARSPFFSDQVVDVEDGAVVVDRELARQITMEARRAAGQTPSFGGIEATLAGEDGSVSESTVRDAIASFAASTDAAVRVEGSAVPFDPESIDGASTDALDFETIRANFGGDADVFTSADADELLGEELYIVNMPGGQSSVSLYETADREELLGEATLRDASAVSEFVDRLRTTTTDDLDALGIEAVGPSEQTRESRQRRETRQAGREAAEAAGVDLDEFDVGATAEGEVILQDEDTGRTRTIDADTSGGLGAALDAETSGGEFVADAADSAAGSTSAGGLGARAVAAIVLLLGAIAAAVGWSG